MAGCVGQVGWRDAVTHRPSSSAAWRCTDGVGRVSTGPDPLAAQLVAVLSSVDQSDVTAGILTGLRDARHLPPEPREMP